MGSRRYGLVDLAGILFVALIVTSPCDAQNLLTNPDFSSGIAGWVLSDGTTVTGFPPSGGVDLATNNPAAGGIQQCIPTPALAGGTELAASFVATLLNGESGALRGFLTTFPTPDCTETALGSVLLEPSIDIGTTPFATPVKISGSLITGAGTESVRLFALGAQPMPPAEFGFNVREPVLEVEGGTTGPAPDLTIARLPHLGRVRMGDRGSALVLVENSGDATTSGSWELTISAPPGFRLFCTDLGLDCEGNGTAQLVVRMTAPIPGTGDGLHFAEIGFFFDTANVTPGTEYVFKASVSGGGETNTLNNSYETGSFEVSKPRDAMPVAEPQPVTTDGRGNAGKGGKQ